MTWHGYITSVFVKNGAVICNVKHSGRVNSEATAIPILTSFSGHMVVPKVGQKVVVSSLEDGSEYIEGVLSTEGSDLPELSDGEVTFQFDESTELTFSTDGKGGYNVDVSASGSVNVAATETVTIEGSTTVDISGSEPVTIDGIAFKEHTHEFEDSTISDTGDGSGSESTSTKTTDLPQ